MPKIADLTREQLKSLTDEQKQWLAEDYIKANIENIDRILKNTDIPEKMKKALIKDIEIENQNLKTELDEAKKKLLEADKALTQKKLPSADQKYPLSLGEFASTMALMALHKDGQPVKGLTTERVNKYREMTSKTAGAGMEAEDWSEGGALITPEYSAELIRLGYESAGLINLARNMTVTGNSLEIRFIRDADESGGYVSGGVRVYWIDKETAPNATKPVTDRMKFELKKIGGLSYADIELLEDAPLSIEQNLQNDFATAFAMAMDDGMINGEGAGELLGVLKSPCLISVAIESGQTLTGDPIMFENINKMYAHLPASSKRRAVWSVNSDMIPEFPKMNLVVGAGGTGVFLPVGGISGSPFSTLYGRPIVENDCQQALGTKGDIVLGDWSQYGMVRKSNGVRYETSMHFKFDTDEMAFKWIWRMDGKSLWYTYKTPRRGSMTKSPFVTLDART